MMTGAIHPTSTLPGESRDIQLIDYFDNAPCQMIFGQPILE